jgi:hypothetical protein
MPSSSPATGTATGNSRSSSGLCATHPPKDASVRTWLAILALAVGCFSFVVC